MSFRSGQSPVVQEPVSPEFNVRQFGARGDGRTNDTEAINGAILAAKAAGGGVVVLPPGDYLSHSLRLCSHLCLRLLAGATLIADDPPPAGEPGGYDAPEEGAPNIYQDFGHSRFRNSLLWGENLTDVSICGPGRIYGRGLSRGNGRIALPVGAVAPQPPGHLPDVLEADGPIVPELSALEAGPFGYPKALDTLPAGVGNKAIALLGCSHVILRDLVVLHGGHFAVLATACEHLHLDHLFIDTNRDGIDIDACSNVTITNCSVNSPWDDGICIKASYGAGVLRPVENVTVSNCYVSGFEEGSLYDGRRSRVIRHRGGPIGRIKLGTEASGGFRNIAITNCIFEFCRGLALEQVDGSMMEDIVVSNLTMREVMNAPLFIRLGARLRAPGACAPGTACRISISNVIAYDVAPEHGIFIAGLPGHPVSDVQLSNIQLYSRGGLALGDAAQEVPELPAAYPEPMGFGTLPAWGLYVRHATRLRVRDIVLSLLHADARPAILLEDLSNSEFSGLRLPEGATAQQWVSKALSRLRVRDCDGRADA